MSIKRSIVVELWDSITFGNYNMDNPLNPPLKGGHFSFRYSPLIKGARGLYFRGIYKGATPQC